MDRKEKLNDMDLDKLSKLANFLRELSQLHALEEDDTRRAELAIMYSETYIELKQTYESARLQLPMSLNTSISSHATPIAQRPGSPFTGR